jgi:3-oxo-5alpha-steroid 4-dehydrogenase
VADSGAAPIAPLRDGDIETWDHEADVVVVGLGIAGACAALSAAEAGAEVLVLERASSGGGTSAAAHGILYLGGGTRVQKACGFEDSPDDMYRFLMATLAPSVDEEKVRLYCDRSIEHFEWLVEKGVPFKNSFDPEAKEPPGDDGLLFSGAEDTWPFDRIARPAPRGHVPKVEGDSGAFLMERLLGALGRTAARTLSDARCEALVQDAAERVVGVSGQHAGRALRVRARSGVVLATGGFILNDAMLERHAIAATRCSWKLAGAHDDGAGIRMGMGAGAQAAHLDALSISMMVRPPWRLCRGILVNRYGQRFANEDAYYGRLGELALSQPGSEVYMLHDDETYEVNAAGWSAGWAAGSIEELEREAGFPLGSLQSTVETYNRQAARGEDRLFHKRAEFLKPLDKPPFGLVDASAASRDYAVFTVGGLQTRAGGEVVAARGGVVDGLFAAGRTTCPMGNGGYVSGLSLGDGSFFGRQAGASAARG